MARSNYLEKLKKTKKEAEVQNIWNKIFGMTDLVNLSANTDGLFEDKLFEFKFDAKFHQSGQWSKSAHTALAQSIYYLRKIANFDFEGATSLPSIVVILDKSSGFMIPTKQLERIVGGHEKDLNVDWRRAPSNPDPVFVKWLMDNAFLDSYRVKNWEFSTEETVLAFQKAVLDSQFSPAKIEITEENFTDIYKVWMEMFCSDDMSPTVVADYYVLDINLTFKFIEGTDVLYNQESKEEWKVSRSKYEKFWAFYKRPPSVKVQKHILSCKDCLYDIQTRDDTGDFYTPINVAKLARKYLGKILPENKRDEILWWDPAAGGANLFIEATKKENVILSTLLDRDFRTLKSQSVFGKSTIECSNFLKGETPQPILDQLNDHAKAPLVFLLNPPFNDQTGHSEGTDDNPNQVDNSFIAKSDKDALSLRALRGVYAKFMYRIAREIEDCGRKEAYVAIFTKTAWLTGRDHEKFRDYWNGKFLFESGFIVPSMVFRGTRGQWPVLFSVWKLRKGIKECNMENKVKVEIFDYDLNLIGSRDFRTSSSTVTPLCDFAEKKCLKSLKKTEFVPLKNEFQVYDSAKIYCKHLHEDAIGYLRTISNDIQNSDKRLALFSAPYGGSNGNGFSIVGANFESSLMIYGIRKSINSDWLNDKDEFLVPKEFSSSDDFSTMRRKAVLWSILDGGYTSSLRNVEWEGQNFNIFNGFFALGVDQLSNLSGVDSNLLPGKDSLASRWIDDHSENFSKVEKLAYEAYIRLIEVTLGSGNRRNGDVHRQLLNPDASPRQLINGMLRYSGLTLTEDEKNSFDAYLSAVRELRCHLSQDVLTAEIIVGANLFEADEDSQAA